MKEFVRITFLLFLTSSVWGQIVNNDWDFFAYTYDKNFIKINKVETVTIEQFISGKKSPDKAIYYFDTTGLLTKQTTIDSTGEIKKEFYFATNSHKDLISRIKKNYEDNRSDTVIFFKWYDGNKLIKDSSSELPFAYNYEYDKNGVLVKTKENLNFGIGNNAKKIIANQFDYLYRITNITETVYRNDNDSTGTQFSNRDIFYYDNGKVRIEKEKLNSKYSWSANKGSITYSYDSSGNLTQVHRTNAASEIYTYNHKGLITTKITDMSIKDVDILDTDIKIEILEKYSYTFRQ